MSTGFLDVLMRKKDLHNVSPAGRRMMGLLIVRVKERKKLEYGLEINGRRIEAIKMKLREMDVPSDFI